MPRLGRIVCFCGNRVNGHNFIGAIELSRPNISHHFCNRCKKLYEYAVDEKGVVTKKIIKKHIIYDDIMCVELKE